MALGEHGGGTGRQGALVDVGAGRSPSAPSSPPSAVRSGFALLAVFDGIRGCSVALRSLGVEPAADYSSEVDSNCTRLIHEKFPGCRQLGDIRKLDKVLLRRLVDDHGVQMPWLVVGGSPCQDLSKRRGPNRKGLQGKKSKLFFEFVRVVSMLMSLGVRVAFLLENVASMPPEERDTITACLGVEPVEIDAAIVSACHRQRYYWTNLHVVPLEPREVDIDALLDDGWRRHPPGKPFRCFVASAAWQVRRGRDPLGVRRCPTATGGRPEGKDDEEEERAPNAGEREAILGFPRGHTQLSSPDGQEDTLPEGTRLKMLGNSFSVQVVAHLLSPFVDCVKAGRPLELRPLREGARLLTMDRLVDDQDAHDGVMEDIWE